jgi:hypothetical protein
MREREVWVGGRTSLVLERSLGIAGQGREKRNKWHPTCRLQLAGKDRVG